MARGVLKENGIRVSREEKAAARARKAEEAARKKAEREAKKQADAAARAAKKAEAAAKRARKAEEAARKKAAAALEKRRKTAIKDAVAALNALLKDARKIGGKGSTGAERVRRAKAVRDAAESDVLPALRALVSLLDDAVELSAPAIEAALRDFAARGRRGPYRIPELRQALGVPRDSLHATLLSMARERQPVIDLQIAADPSAVEDPDEGIRTEGGLLYYVSLRR